MSMKSRSALKLFNTMYVVYVVYEKSDFMRNPLIGR
jgi:hypothetical protein